MIPVACVGVHYQFGRGPQIFSRALAQFRGWAAWLNWQGLPSAELKLRHPRALRLSPSLPVPYERGEGGGGALHGIAPLPCPRAILVLRDPFRGSPVPTTLSRSLGPLAYSGRLVPHPGCPPLNTRFPTATLPAGQ